MIQIASVGKYVSVWLASMVKFVAGPLTASATGLTYWESVLFTILGMMSTVLIFVLAGRPLIMFLKHKFWSKRKVFTKRNRRFVSIWTRWGIPGVSFLTPLLFTPIGGALLATLFSGDKHRILLYMFISAIFWGFAISGLVYGVIHVSGVS